MNRSLPRVALDASVLLLSILAGALGVAGCNGDGLLGAPCDSSRDCSADSLICDTDARECVECLADVDCFGEGEICLNRSCQLVTTCESSRQCPGQVCDTARGFCVDCVEDVDCPGEQTCEDSACVDPPPSCESDRQCSELGMVCATDRGICVECVRPEDCVEGFTCSGDNRCVRRNTDCDPGIVECAGESQFRRCRSDGTWGQPLPCLEGQTCDGGTCSDPSCDPACDSGEICVEGVCQALTCSPDCTGDEVCTEGVCRCGDGARCGAGTVCSGGSCVPTSCDPACAVGESCVEGTCQCGSGPSCTGGQVCEGGACVDPACVPACDAGETCVAGACRCGTGPACGSGETCDAGTCRPVTCTPACDSGETCVSGACMCGSGPPCGSGQACVSGTCRPTTCTPGCAAGETCDFGICRCGTGPACTGGQTCVSGTCTTPPMCSESPCRVVSPQCGCSPGQMCDYRSGTRGCFSAGTRTEGQACDTSNPCAPGLTCTGPSGATFCARYCDSDSDCPSGGGSLCLMEIQDSGGASLHNICGIDCDPLTNTGCRSNTSCEIMGVRMGTSEAVTWCRGINVLPLPFPVCGVDSCPAGETCVGSGTCTTYCRIGRAGDCPSPQVCTAYTDHPRIRGVEYGYCQ